MFCTDILLLHKLTKMWNLMSWSVILKSDNHYLETCVHVHGYKITCRPIELNYLFCVLYWNEFFKNYSQVVVCGCIVSVHVHTKCTVKKAQKRHTDRHTHIHTQSSTMCTHKMPILSSRVKTTILAAFIVNGWQSSIQWSAELFQ